VNPPADSALADPQQIIADLRRQLAERTAERDEALARGREALEQQTATADVLKVISRTEAKLEAVLETLVETAARICAADQGAIHQLHDGFHFVSASFGTNPEYRDYVARNPIAPGRGTAIGRMALERRAIHVEDVLRDPEYTGSEFQRLAGFRSVLAAPLIRDDVVIGSMLLTRSRVEPFTDKQIELVLTFADQAVIAIENARLITETREALERQTAISEVLKVISQATFDLEVVLQTVLDSAVRLCGAAGSEICLLRDGACHWAVGHDQVPEYQAVEKAAVIYPGPGTLVGRVAVEGRIVHVIDALMDPLYELKDQARTSRYRTMLGVPLMRDGIVIGVVAMSRRTVQAFTDREIELVSTFADQAVIAIENARLITDTREALDQQTATAEVLGVINASPGDLAPVFSAILEKAHTLCGATHGHLTVYDGEHFRAAATRGVPEDFAALLRQPFRPGLDVARRLLAGEMVIHLPDMATLSYEPEDRVGRGAVELGGARTLLIVALRKDATLLGYLTAHRTEVRPFSDKQIALLRNFATQAVIAMENARLVTETREALEQQTATAEVLGVINSSPGDLTPVFDAILDKAHILCGAAVGTLFLYDGAKNRAAAVHGYPDDVAARLRAGVAPPPPLLAGARMVHRHDVREYPDDVGLLIARRAGVRTNLLIPLRKEGAFLGMISCNRQEVRPYSDKEISLIENFAAPSSPSRMRGSLPRRGRRWSSRPRPPRSGRYQ
jgi:GAF domain-containing protein